MSPRAFRWGKAGLSLFLAFHLFCILVAPNKETYLGQRVAFLIEPYINMMEFATSWNFFAPEPGPPPVFVEWEVLDRRGEVAERGRMPESPDPFFLRERQNRRIAVTRFLVATPERTEKVMRPYLCRRVSGADSVRLWRVQYTFPPLRDVAEGKRRIGDDVGADRRWVSHSYCEPGGQS